MLVKGSIPDQGTMDPEVTREYREMFNDMFMSNGQQAEGLHLITTLNDKQTLRMVALTAKTNVLITGDSEQEKLRVWFNEFLSKDVGLDESEIDWLKAFTQMALGNLDGFYFIAKQHKISYADSNTYKAICAVEYDDMEDFFLNINAFVPYKISKDITRVLRKDVTGVWNIFLNKFDSNDTFSKMEDDILYDQDSEQEQEMPDQEREFRMRIATLFDIMESKDVNEINLKSFVAKLEMNKEIMDIILGFNGLLNFDVPKILNMIKSLLKLIRQSDEYSYVKNIINFAAFNDRDDVLLSLIYEIAERKNLSLSLDDLDYDEQIKSADFRFLVNLNKAVNGDLDCLGFICDSIYFKNESRVLTTIGKLFKTDKKLTFAVDPRNTMLAKQCFQFEMSAIIDTIYKVVCGCQYDTYNSFNNDSFALLGISIKNNKMIKDFDNQLSENTVKSTLNSNTNYLIEETESIFKSSRSWIKKQLRGDMGQINLTMMTYEKRNFEMKFKSDIRNASLKHDFLKLNEGKKVLRKTREKELADEFGYIIKDNSVIFKIPKMFELILTAVSGDQEGLFTLIEMLLPLYREIIGAPKFFEVMMPLLNENQDKLVKMIPTLVKTVMYSAIRKTIQHHTALTDEDIMMIEDEFEIKPSHITAVSTWIRTIIMLTSKDKHMSADEYTAVMLK